MCMYVVSWRKCGWWSRPLRLLSDSPATLRIRGYSRASKNATLDIRKVDNAWSQTGCFNLGGTLPESGPVPASSTQNVYSSGTVTLSPVDYNSLYVARLFWVDNEGTNYYNRDGDCYFTLQPGGWI